MKILFIMVLIIHTHDSCYQNIQNINCLKNAIKGYCFLLSYMQCMVLLQLITEKFFPHILIIDYIKLQERKSLHVWMISLKWLLKDSMKIWNFSKSLHVNSFNKKLIFLRMRHFNWYETWLYIFIYLFVQMHIT